MLHDFQKGMPSRSTLNEPSRFRSRFSFSLPTTLPNPRSSGASLPIGDAASDTLTSVMLRNDRRASRLVLLAALLEVVLHLDARNAVRHPVGRGLPLEIMIEPLAHAHGVILLV